MWGVIAAQALRDKQDMLRGVGRRPVDTAEEAAVRRRRRSGRGSCRVEGRGEKRERGREGGRAANCGGQSALTAAGVAEWDLSRLDRWTDRAMPHWRSLALDASTDVHPQERTQTSM